MMKTIGLLTAAAALMVAGSADAAKVYHPVMLDGKRVQARLVGGISAEPCSRPRGCGEGLVQLRWGGVAVATHPVRCLHPRGLRMIGANHGARHSHAFVFACRRLYRWRLPS